MEFTRRFLLSEGRSMPMWHGPSRNFAAQLAHELFWHETIALFNRLGRRGHAYPGKVPEKGTKAICRAIGYFMRGALLTPGMINRVINMVQSERISPRAARSFAMSPRLNTIVLKYARTRRQVRRSIHTDMVHQQKVAIE